MTTTPIIQIRDVHKSFGDKRVLNGVNLDIAVGESVVVIGGSGTGKSVLLKCILGLLSPESGSIRVDGIETINMPDVGREVTMRRFGMLFQGAALFDSLTVWENVAFALIQGRKMRKQEAKSIALTKLAQVGLGPDVGELNPSALSGGMQKRVALARAIATDPEILFFDEPSAGLDPISSRRLDDLILELKESLGITFIVVTHELPSIFAIADDSIFLDAETKTILARGRPVDLRESCREASVRRFLLRESEPLQL